MKSITEFLKEELSDKDKMKLAKRIGKKLFKANFVDAIVPSSDTVQIHIKNNNVRIDKKTIADLESGINGKFDGIAIGTKETTIALKKVK